MVLLIEIKLYIHKFKILIFLPVDSRTYAASTHIIRKSKILNNLLHNT